MNSIKEIRLVSIFFSTFLLLVFNFDNSYGQHNCELGYELRNVMCDKKITQICVPENLQCRACWKIQTPDCYGNYEKGCAPVSHGCWYEDSYDLAVQCAEKMVANAQKETSPCSSCDYTTYRIFLTGDRYCTSGAFANQAVRQDAISRANITINGILGQLRDELIRVAAQRVRFPNIPGGVFDEYEENIEASRYQIERYRDHINQKTDISIDEINNTISNINNEQTQINSYKSNFNSNIKQEERKIAFEKQQEQNEANIKRQQAQNEVNRKNIELEAERKRLEQEKTQKQIDLLNSAYKQNVQTNTEIINSITTGVNDYIEQKSERDRIKREQIALYEEEERREEEKERLNSEAKLARMKKEEQLKKIESEQNLIKWRNIIAPVFYNLSVFTKKTSDINDPNLKSVYYVLWSFDNQNKIRIYKPFEERRSADGDWRTFSDVCTQFSETTQTNFYKTPENYPTQFNAMNNLIGYFETNEKAELFYSELLQNFKNNDFNVTEIDINKNNNHENKNQQINKSFWDE